jgi:hypothetical protein
LAAGANFEHLTVDLCKQFAPPLPQARGFGFCHHAIIEKGGQK